MYSKIFHTTFQSFCVILNFPVNFTFSTDSSKTQVKRWRAGEEQSSHSFRRGVSFKKINFLTYLLITFRFTWILNHTSNRIVFINKNLFIPTWAYKPLFFNFAFENVVLTSFLIRFSQYKPLYCSFQMLIKIKPMIMSSVNCDWFLLET